jgi:hypothetical protein
MEEVSVMGIKNDDVIKSVYAASQFRMRYVDSFFNGLSVGDKVRINSPFYKNILARIIQKTDYLIVLQDVNRSYIRPVVSKFDYYCGACKIEKLASALFDFSY